jgi:hypothetical protein
MSFLTRSFAEQNMGHPEVLEAIVALNESKNPAFLNIVDEAAIVHVSHPAPDILFGVPTSVKNAEAVVQIMQKRANAELSERVKVILFEDTGTEAGNVAALENAAITYGASMVIPVMRDTDPDAVTEQLDLGLLIKYDRPVPFDASLLFQAGPFEKLR